MKTFLVVLYAILCGASFITAICAFCQGKIAEAIFFCVLACLSAWVGGKIDTVINL